MGRHLRFYHSWVKKKFYLFFFQAWVRFEGENAAVDILEKVKDSETEEIKIKSNVLKGDILEGKFFLFLKLKFDLHCLVYLLRVSVLVNALVLKL